ncbi:MULTISPECIES: hypothetical protein [Haloarcula]|uniref:hypothetical protein n=1 Tax=Haloarcula TaxID=2237 RepID=UPI0023EDFEFE|nr:hypothetical protein [Halomicroarcula sp. XH51]
MLERDETEFVELVLDVGSRALDQDPFEFMIDEGVPVDEFGSLCSGDNIDEVARSLEAKGLAYTESHNEIIRYTPLPDDEIEQVDWGDTGFKTVDRQYIYFTNELEDLYRA